MHTVYSFFVFVCICSVPLFLLLWSIGYENKGLVLKEVIYENQTKSVYEKTFSVYSNTVNLESLCLSVCITVYSLLYIVLSQYDEENGNILQCTDYSDNNDDIPVGQKNLINISTILFLVNVYIQKYVYLVIVIGSNVLFYIEGAFMQDSIVLYALFESLVVLACCDVNKVIKHNIGYTIMRFIVFVYVKLHTFFILLQQPIYESFSVKIPICYTYSSIVSINIIQLWIEILLILGHSVEIETTCMTVLNCRLCFNACCTIFNTMFPVILTNNCIR
jgi:hypothetical protein